MDFYERVCRAVYYAHYKNGEGRAFCVRRTEAYAYRESCSGRIAVLIHNNSVLVPSHLFTLVCREAFRHDAATSKLTMAMTLYDERIEERTARSVDLSNRCESVRISVD